MSSKAPSFPVPHKKLTVDIKGNKTDIVICSYDDYFLVIVTQIGSMGTVIHASKEEGMSIHPTFDVSVVLGKREEPILVACARQLIEQIRYLSFLLVLAAALAHLGNWCYLLASRTILKRL